LNRCVPHAAASKKFPTAGTRKQATDYRKSRLMSVARLALHATKLGPRNAISCREELIDGAIAAFHNDRYSDELLSALAPKFPGINAEALDRALDHPVGPLIATPAIHVTPGLLQISPADERCRLGELTSRQDSESPYPELSGELFTVRSTAYAG
jgi:hypothetical protein